MNVCPEGAALRRGEAARRAGPGALMTIDRATDVVLTGFAGKLLVDPMAAHLPALPATPRPA